MSRLDHLRRCVIAAEAYRTSVEGALIDEIKLEAERIVRQRQRALRKLEEIELGRWADPPPTAVIVYDVKPWWAGPPRPPALQVLP